MTTPARENDEPIVLAMERAGRALGDGADAGTVFLEERSDLRLVLRSDDRRDLTVTHSRGAAVGGRNSVHVSDPGLEQLEALARGEPVGFPPVPAWPSVEPPAKSWEFDSVWLRLLESSLTAQLQRETRGIPECHWSATLITSHQLIWVAGKSLVVGRDKRRGCRAEVRVRIGWHPNSSATEECLIGWNETAFPGMIIRRALERADRKRGDLAVPVPGPTSAVFAPGVGGVVIHELVGHALEGDANVRRKTWIQCEALPRPPRDIGVVDDPRRGRCAWLIDDEGVASQETLLVAAGRPVGLILDRETAAARGKRSTGHGRRSSYLTPVRPRMGCTFIAPGPDEPRELLGETAKGVFIHRLTAGHTDPVAGRASFVVSESDAIVGGELGAPLAPFVIELDGPDAWSSLDRVGHDLAFDTCVGSCIRDGQPLAVSVGAPTIRIRVVRVVS